MVVLPLTAFVLAYSWGGARMNWSRLIHNVPTATMMDPEAAWFAECTGRNGHTCVIDGDSIVYKGREIRLVGFNAPELGEPRCERERELGEKAQARLRQLLNAGPFRMTANNPSKDRFGRDLVILTRQGKDIGDPLVVEGLAHAWHGRKGDWCARG